MSSLLQDDYVNNGFNKALGMTRATNELPFRKQHDIIVQVTARLKMTGSH